MQARCGGQKATTGAGKPFGKKQTIECEMGVWSNGFLYVRQIPYR